MYGDYECSPPIGSTKQIPTSPPASAQGPGRISAVKVQTDLDCAEWSTLAFVAYLISTVSHRALSGQIALELEPWSTLEAGEPS